MEVWPFPDKSVDEGGVIINTSLFIDEFETYFDQQVVGEIQKAIDNEMGAAAYILISCAIDCLASFWEGKDSVGETYKGFVNSFLAGYNADHLYKDLRCRMVHNYTLGENLIMCWHEADLHKEQPGKGQIVINLEQFFEDFKQAKRLYFAQLRRDSNLQDKLQIRWYEVGILSPICPDAVRSTIRSKK